MSAVEERLREILAAHSSGQTKDPKNIDTDAPVFGPLGVVLDSLAVLDALSEIERCFEISIPDEDLNEELFSSVRSLISYVEIRTNERGMRFSGGSAGE